MVEEGVWCGGWDGKGWVEGVYVELLFISYLLELFILYLDVLGKFRRWLSMMRGGGSVVIVGKGEEGWGKWSCCLLCICCTVLRNFVHISSQTKLVHRWLSMGMGGGGVELYIMHLLYHSACSSWYVSYFY